MVGEIHQQIERLGFKEIQEDSGLYTKAYDEHNYQIDIDISKGVNSGRIIYNEPLIVHDKTTSNFKKQENMVVLECVDRLLKIGYKPKNMELEKRFKVGHTSSGKPDILIRDGSGRVYMMIECKTYGAAHKGEINNIKKDGGQLVSYFQQDKDTKILALYSSEITAADTKYTSDMMECSQEMREANSVSKTYTAWNKKFKQSGIFEEDSKPYNTEIENIKIKDLKIIQQNNSEDLFDKLREVLRHNVISDKANAFNKIFNLFLCKLEDENKKNDEECAFQWKNEDDNINFLTRLNQLYADGVKNYLNKEVENISDEDMDKMLAKNNQDAIKNKITKVILYKNNEFALTDVYDEKSFNKNAEIVREIVEIIQIYKIRYAQKHQFLGDFFELLLNTGFKQETGQFFTPVPLARFIVKSIPMEEIIQNKIQQGEAGILPYTIDYAMGTGHFLTEAMEEIQEIVDSGRIKGNSQSSDKEIKTIQDKSMRLDWAEKYIYGIEKDYRLVKTAKVACFLNGDGLANIIHADGLDNFIKSEEYQNKLKKVKSNKKDNEQFDIVIANPPYSIDSFKNTMKNGSETFDLFKILKDKSSEIECLFIERTKQLAKPGAYAGVVLPRSILESKKAIYVKAREIIFKNFRVNAIAKFGQHTFMATGTKTAILFLEKREIEDVRYAENNARKLIEGKEKIKDKFADTIFPEYTQEAYGLKIENYRDAINGRDDKADLYKRYSGKMKKVAEDEIPARIKEIEINKLATYILNKDLKAVIIDSKGGAAEKSLLGYEFSDRAGKEGITVGSKEDEKYEGGLYNPEKDDEKKLNYYIKSNFLNFAGEMDINKAMKNHVKRKQINDIIDYSEPKFELVPNLLEQKNNKIKSSNIKKPKNMEYLKDICTIKRGTSITKKTAIPGDIPVIAGGKTVSYYHSEANFKGRDLITISASGTAGYVWFHDYPIWASDCFVIYSNDESVFKTKFIYHCLRQKQEELYERKTGTATPHVYQKDFENEFIPKASIKRQEEIIQIFENYEREQKESAKKVKEIDEIIKVFTS